MNYKKNATNLQDDLSKDGNLILKTKQRYVLYDIIKKLNLKDTDILLPVYTCNSLVEVIKETQNHPLFYSIKDFTVDENEIKQKIKKYNVSIMIVSDIFGIKVEVPLKLYSENIIFIGDFAHHIHFLHKKDKRKFDIVMYSSSFYKPMVSNGIGIGIVLNTKKVNIESINELRNDFFHLLLSFCRLYLIQYLLSSKLLKLFIRDKEKNSSIVFKKSECNNVPSIYDFSLLYYYKLNGKTILQNLNKKRQRLAEKYKKINSLQLYESKYCSTYFNILVKNKKEFQKYLLDKRIFVGSIFTDYAGKDYVEDKDLTYLSNKIINLPFINEHNEDYILNVIKEYKNV
ncbi:hypothetical protein Q6A75_05885 [Aliarcobacter skirrowii]|uniref:hypothetical protein n=1 Tax=Aliarcobacter skirrowii TaxID=28200 RepID=UPI0029B5A4E4|nr:hypothetical protein [Aliarcobacter skirrowii]MDX4048459.1 hypothetical protein [Aliarcobacter skirrowii]